jgi:hypothetical protein
VYTPLKVDADESGTAPPLAADDFPVCAKAWLGSRTSMHAATAIVHPSRISRRPPAMRGSL